MKPHKKYLSLFLAVICLLSLSTSAFAADTQTTESQQYYVTVLDENGTYVNYAITDGETVEIPLFSNAIDENGISTQTLTQVATLYFTTRTILGEYYLSFEFVPTNFGISLLTLGFTGSMTTYHRSGTRWGANFFTDAGRGTCCAASGGTGSLAGTYTVIGFEPVSVVQGVST